MNLFTKQKQTHRHRKQTYGYQRGTVGGGINYEFGINIYTTLLYIKQITNQGITVQHRELYSISCNNELTMKNHYMYLKKKTFLIDHIKDNNFLKKAFIDLTAPRGGNILQLRNQVSV